MGYFLPFIGTNLPRIFCGTKGDTINFNGFVVQFLDLDFGQWICCLLLFNGSERQEETSTRQGVLYQTLFVHTAIMRSLSLHIPGTIREKKLDTSSL